jgi:hypothetical protein
MFFFFGRCTSLWVDEIAMLTCFPFFFFLPACVCLLQVEHLLRDINDPSVSSLAGTIKHKMAALRGLKESLEEMRDYLQKCVDGA